MVTFTGTQTKLTDAIIDLVELEYDAVEAYEAAIERIENIVYKTQLRSFRDDHNRHLGELRNFLENLGLKTPKGPDAKKWLTKGKTILAGLVGDKAILHAMDSNEIDTNIAYHRMIKRKDLDDEIKLIIDRAYEDEKKHKQWIENTLKKI